MTQDIINQLQNRIDKLEEVGEQCVDEADVSFGFNTWRSGTVILMRKILPNETDAISTIAGLTVKRIYFHSTDYLSYSVEACKKEAYEVLNVLIETAKLGGSPTVTKPVNQKAEEPFWSLLHPKVVELARKKFSDGYIADAVVTCLKEANTIIKAHVKSNGGDITGLDGVSLMNTAFSHKRPYIKLADDLTTDDGKNIQIGYMNIFAGMMQGIRNPKSHSNYNLDKSRGIHFLFMCSFLFIKLEEARIIS